MHRCQEKWQDDEDQQGSIYANGVIDLRNGVPLVLFVHPLVLKKRHLDEPDKVALKAISVHVVHCTPRKCGCHVMQECA